MTKTKKTMNKSTKRLCTCSCGLELKGKTSLFKPGHDQRLFGKLTRISSGVDSATIPTIVVERRKDIGFIQTNLRLRALVDRAARKSSVKRKAA